MNRLRCIVAQSDEPEAYWALVEAHGLLCRALAAVNQSLDKFAEPVAQDDLEPGEHVGASFSEAQTLE